MKRPFDKSSERLAQTAPGRFKFFFSIEFTCAMGLAAGLTVLARRLGIIAAANGSVDLPLVIIMILSMVIPFGIGELIRRKLGLGSILFSQKRK